LLKQYANYFSIILIRIHSRFCYILLYKLIWVHFCNSYKLISYFFKILNTHPEYWLQCRSFEIIVILNSSMLTLSYTITGTIAVNPLRFLTWHDWKYFSWDLEINVSFDVVNLCANFHSSTPFSSRKNDSKLKTFFNHIKLRKAQNWLNSR
jgi:hypothetical protein